MNTSNFSFPIFGGGLEPVGAPPLDSSLILARLAREENNPSGYPHSLLGLYSTNIKAHEH